jgi:hypothetical protein
VAPKILNGSKWSQRKPGNVIIHACREGQTEYIRGLSSEWTQRNQVRKNPKECTKGKNNAETVHIWITTNVGLTEQTLETLNKREQILCTEGFLNTDSKSERAMNVQHVPPNVSRYKQQHVAKSPVTVTNLLGPCKAPNYGQLASTGTGSTTLCHMALLKGQTTLTRRQTNSNCWHWTPGKRSWN